MSFSRKHNRQLTTWLATGIGLIIVLTFVISLLNPGLSTSDDDAAVVTFTPGTTELPPPDPNPDLAGAPPYIHSSGYFQTFMPAGADWTAYEDPDSQDDNFVSVVIRSGERLAVVHNYIRRGVEYESVEALNQDYLTVQHFAEGWTDYESWRETGRTVGADSITTDFGLVSDENDYLGRDITRLEDGSLYVTRLVVPGNNPGLLDTLQSYVVPAFRGFPEMQALPRVWPAYADQEYGFLFKHPAGWPRVAGGPGRPTTFSASTGEGDSTVRLWAEPDRAVETASDAEAWLTELVPSAEVIGIDPLTHARGEGYQVAYRYRDAEGDSHSGLFVALAGSAGTVFAANLQLAAPELNLLEGETLSDAQADARRAVVEGFVPLPLESREAPPPSVDATEAPAN